MASEVEICNMGLRYIGAKVIASLTENSQEARDCNLFYAQSRDTVLRDHPWNFAHKRRTLAAFTIPDDYTGEYLYAYALPGDCLKPRKIYEPEATKDSPFKLMRVPTKERILFTDVEEAILAYTMRVEDVTWFDAEFIEALALKMAASLAVPLLKSIKARDSMLEQYKYSLPQAEVSNTKEDNPKDESSDTWIASRTS